MSVLLSSHVLAELERVADYLILMSRGRVQVAGEVDDPPRRPPGTDRPGRRGRHTIPNDRSCVSAGGEAQAHLLVRATAHDPVPPGWEAHPVGLEELALAYLREPGARALPGPARAEDAEPSEVTK